MLSLCLHCAACGGNTFISPGGATIGGGDPSSSVAKVTVPSDGGAADLAQAGSATSTDTTQTAAPVAADTAQAAAHPHTRCGWIDDEVGEASFVAHASEFHWVHPRWYTISSDGVSILTANHPDLASILDAAKANDVRIAPLIDSLDVAYVRTMISDDAKRAAHVQALVDLVKTHGYAGIDIDYEHLWSSVDRPGFLAFMTALSTGLHAVGAELSMAAPGLVDDPKENAYDYVTLASVCDTLHVMGYDFHYYGGDHEGPLAPAGWIDAVFAHAQSTGHADKFMLGVANYGISETWWGSARTAAALCTTASATTTDHMADCPYGDYASGRALNCSSADYGQIWYEDVGSMEEKILIAQKYGARGVTYWTIGDELDGYFAMVRSHFP